MTATQNKPYLIDSVIGNGRILACLTKNGELVRAFWPTIDYAQHVNRTQAAIRVGGGEQIHWLSSDEFTHTHQYVDDTNIVETTYSRQGLNLGIKSLDFVSVREDVIVRHYELTNTGDSEMEVDFLYLSDFHMEESPIYQSVLYDNNYAAIGHYRRAYWAMIGGAERPFGYQVGNVQDNLHSRRFDGGMITLGSDGALVWTAKVAPGATVTFPVYIAFGKNREEAGARLEVARRTGSTAIRTNSEKWAAEFLARGRQVATGDERLDTMYRRSLLVFSLMADSVFGGLIAAPEFDPFYTKCGGYGYCWGRDAAYITTAIDKAGYTDIGRKFYQWAIKAQEADGSWDHRHYMNGDFAPAWGYQADEPASILWGMWQHYLITQDAEFLALCWNSMQRGADHLLASISMDNHQPAPSFDLWEERYAQHTYSSAAVAAALLAVADAAQQLGYIDLADGYRAAGERIREEVEQLFNTDKQSWYRGVNLHLPKHEFEARMASGEEVFTVQDVDDYTRYIAKYDTIVDASLLGLSYPFELFDANHPHVVATAEAVRNFCTQPGVGGIRRYENDHYAGGNPWVLCTLWLALDANRRGDADTIQQAMEWVLKNQTSTGLLPEQVDKVSGGPDWVAPLTWSHAMYVLTILEHYAE